MASVIVEARDVTPSVRTEDFSDCILLLVAMLKNKQPVVVDDWHAVTGELSNRIKPVGTRRQGQVRLGAQSVKNIAEPVRAYRWSDAIAAPARAAPLALPDKPSIAVLPFVNMSGDPKQEYFSDGITEDIITELSRFATLFVIARNSSFHFKGKAVKVSEIGRDLGVQYVVEGSVRKAGNRVRVTAQLVEAASGNHIWAERYDRELVDIFEVQDEVAHTVAATVSGRLDDAGAERARRRPTEDLAAYDLFLRAYQHVHR
ncbi:MAG: adenylate/guanylate cyclase domain-containing protein, partial [Proteobacteria bacterium]|nr:adenylate/guanylate cyclase domain-containing protein [Pseudomonadota bacterium]